MLILFDSLFLDLKKSLKLTKEPPPTCQTTASPSTTQPSQPTSPATNPIPSPAAPKPIA